MDRHVDYRDSESSSVVTQAVIQDALKAVLDPDTGMKRRICDCITSGLQTAPTAPPG